MPDKKNITFIFTIAATIRGNNYQYVIIMLKTKICRVYQALKKTYEICQ